MFNLGDTAYFVFRGNWINGCYNGYYCLYAGYFPFMPVIIKENYSVSCYTELSDGTYWSIHKDCLEKEFSFSKFILAQLEWSKRTTVRQFQCIVKARNGQLIDGESNVDT